MKKQIIYIGLFLALLNLAACSGFNKIMKDSSWRNRYDAAMKYYEKKDYYRAGVLLEDLVPILVGTKEAELAQFYFAKCYFYQSQYTLASHYFKKFHDTYNRSEFAEEAYYMIAYSYYKESAPASLDQASSESAIDALQDFVNRYPTSKFVQEATGFLKELRIRLENKAFDNVKLYYKLELYQSSVIALENFKKDFPDSYLQEEASYLAILAQYKVAQNSYITKQEERYQKTSELYQKYLEKYPTGTFLKEAEKIFVDTQNDLKRVKRLKDKPTL